MVVCKMAAVGCMRDNGTMEGDESSEKEGELIKLCRKNGIHQDCFMGESARDSLDSKLARTERPQRVNGTSKSVSAIFTKPSIPTLRSRKDKISPEQSKRRRRLSKGESTDQRQRCSQDGGRLLGTVDSRELTPCKLELACEGKMGLRCGLGGGCSCPSNTTQEVCASLSPPHLVPEVHEDGVPTDFLKRERRDSNGVVDGRGIPDTPISPLPCLPLPFPKIPSSPGTSPQTLVPGGGSSNNNTLFSSSSSSSSPLSSISSPTGSLAMLFGGTQGSRSQQHAHSLKGSNNNKDNGSSSSSIIINRSASCSNLTLTSPFSTQSAPVATSSNPVSTVATPTEEMDVMCLWKACGSVVNPADLLEHLRIQHVDTQKDGEKFVCEWESCKVAGKASCSMSWLERHVVSHGGHKPFKCILPNCGARFPSQVALHRHVNAHFASEGQSSNNRSNRPRGEESSTRIVRKKNKLKRRRPQCVRNGDFFDSGIMDQLRQQLWDLSEKTQIDLSRSSHHITFQGAVKARRTDDNGKESVLLHWTPDDVLEEAWMASSQVDSNWQRTLPLSHLPAPTVTNLHPSLYRRHRFRKHRRK